MASTIQVLSTLRFTEEQLDRLRSVSSRLSIRQQSIRDDREDISPSLTGDEEIVYGMVPPRELSRLPNLKWVQLHSAGIDHLRDHPIWKTDVQVTTASGVHAVPIGEAVVELMLALARKLPKIIRLQERAEWPKQKWELLLGSELRNKSVAILGYGSIGSEVGRIARLGFDMRVLAMRSGTGSGRPRYNEPGVGDPDGKLPERWFRRDEFSEILAQSDFVVLTLPLTYQTRYIIGEKELQSMKPTAFLINVARGELVDERALVRGIKECWISGAGLDAYTIEPLPRDSQLWHLDNVIVSPHVSAATPNYDDRAIDLFAANLERFIAGSPLLNLVDRIQDY